MRRLLLTLSLALVAVLSALAGDKYQLVTDASTLKVGDQIIIVNNNGEYALGELKSSYCSAVSVEVKDNIIEASDDVQIITLAESPLENYPFLLKVGENKYLYSSDSNNNYLKTTDNTSATGASVKITNDGIECDRTDRNVLLYDYYSNNPRFSFYASKTGEGPAYQISRVYKLVAEEDETPETITNTTFSCSSLGNSNIQPMTDVTIDNAVTLSFAKGSGSNQPGYFSSGKDIRLYANNTMTVTAAEGYKVKKLVFTISDNSQLAAVSASLGTVAPQAQGDKQLTWTGDASEFTLSVSANADFSSNTTKAGQFRFSAVEVTYSSSQGQVDPDPEDPIDPDPDDPDDPNGDAHIQIFDKGLGFPESSTNAPKEPTKYTATDTNITYEIMGCYTNSGYLMVNGKDNAGAYISFALPYNCTALGLTTSGSCSTNDNNTVNIYAGDTKIADNYKVNAQNNTYVVEIPAELQAAGTVYKVESNTTKYNAQFASFTYYGKTNSPEEPETQVATPVVSVEEGDDVYVGTTVTISCATEGALFNGSIEFEEAEQIDLEDEPLPYTLTLTDEMIGLVSISGWATKEGLEDSEMLEDYMFNVVEAPEAPQTVTATVIMKDQELSYGNGKTVTWVSQDEAFKFSTIATITGNTYPRNYNDDLRIYNSNGNVITVTAPEGYSFITANYVLRTAANHVAINGTDCCETDNTYTFEDKATSFELTSVKHSGSSNTNSDIVSMTFVLAAIGDTTSLSEIETVEAEAVYYDLMGRRVENPAGGLYIRKQGSTVTKVIVK